MKINILIEFRKGPWGGGNQFLKALKEKFVEIGAYEEDAEQADVIIFNSHHDLLRTIKVKKSFSNKIFIHRIDGPIFKIRNNDLVIDKKIYFFNNLIADGTIFQSDWSKAENYKQGIKKNKFETTIINAPNPEIFNKKNKSEFNKNKVIKLVATSWSANMKKGFEVYKYLDNNLDFSKHEMTFVGNSPITFKNIKHIQPLSSDELSKQLKQHDIFITASQNDPCSNSLIEALHCGLPAVFLDDGGHPKIVNRGGEAFKNKEEVIEKIKKISDDYKYYKDKINLSNLDSVSEQYYEFAKSIYLASQNKEYKIKKINFYKYYFLIFSYYFFYLKEKVSYYFQVCLRKLKKK